MEAHQGRREHVGAGDDLKAVTDAAVKVVGVLDGLVRYRFKSDPERLGQWKSARNVIGPFRSRKENPDETTPPGGGIAPRK